MFRWFKSLLSGSKARTPRGNTATRKSSPVDNETEEEQLRMYLWKTTDPAALIPYLQHSNPLYRVPAIVRVGELMGPDAIQHISPQLNSPHLDRDIDDKVIVALGKLGEGAVPHLIPILHKVAPSGAAWNRSYLSDHSQPNSWPLDERRRRTTAARALGFTKSIEAARHLAYELLTHSEFNDGDFCKAAGNSLVTIGDAATIADVVNGGVEKMEYESLCSALQFLVDRPQEAVRVKSFVYSEVMQLAEDAPFPRSYAVRNDPWDNQIIHMGEIPSRLIELLRILLSEFPQNFSDGELSAIGDLRIQYVQNFHSGDYGYLDISSLTETAANVLRKRKK